jgi:hypothetical protein
MSTAVRMLGADVLGSLFITAGAALYASLVVWELTHTCGSEAPGVLGDRDPALAAVRGPQERNLLMAAGR